MKIKYLFLFFNLVSFNIFTLQIKNFNLNISEGSYDSSVSTTLNFFGTATSGAQITFEVAIDSNTITRKVVANESNFWSVSIPVENRQSFSNLKISCDLTDFFDVNMSVSEGQIFLFFNNVTTEATLNSLSPEKVTFKGDRTGFEKNCDCNGAKFAGFIKISSVCFDLNNNNWKVETSLEQSSSLNSCISKTAFLIRESFSTLFSITSPPTTCRRLIDPFSLAVFIKYMDKFKVNSHPIILNS